MPCDKVKLSARYVVVSETETRPTRKQVRAAVKHKHMARVLWDMTETLASGCVFLLRGNIVDGGAKIAVQPQTMDFSRVRIRVSFKDTRPSQVYVDYVVPLVDNDMLGQTSATFSDCSAVNTKWKPKAIVAGNLNLKTLGGIMTECIKHAMFAGSVLGSAGFRLTPAGSWACARVHPAKKTAKKTVKKTAKKTAKKTTKKTAKKTSKKTAKKTAR